ncbi:MAG: hypothetical protein IMZ66_03125 [Planctomycetes bacterium]|nr:hypothetical protein [Planctomycetota bacterium]
MDSATAVAEDVASRLAAAGLLEADGAAGSPRFFVSDNPERFREVGARFLGEDVSTVSLVSPEEFFAAPHAAPAGAEGAS